MNILLEREFQAELTKILLNIQKDGETFRLDLTKKVNQITFDSNEVSANLDKISREQSIAKDEVQTLKDEMVNFVKASEENFKRLLSEISSLNQKIDQAGQKKGWFN